jgi:hypothetical protein
MTSKTTFLNDTCHNLGKTGNWRRLLTIRHPEDTRNAVAAERLFDLASQADDISDPVWNSLRPFFNPKNSRYSDAVSRACREVGFRTYPRDIDDFALTILDALAVSA